MSLTAFDASTLHGFIGSPLYARNRSKPSVEGIYGILYLPGTAGFDFTRYRLKTTWAIPSVFGSSTIQGVAIRDITSPDPSVTTAPGWNRIRIRVWGTMFACNPWEAHETETFTDRLNRQHVAYNEGFEIYFKPPNQFSSIARIQDAPPWFRPGTAPVANRIPLNALSPAGASGVKTLAKYYRVDRTVSFSVQNTTSQAGTFYWLGSLGVQRWVTVVGERIDPFAQPNELVDFFASQDNTSAQNVTNPVSYKGRTFRLFDIVDGQTGTVTGSYQVGIGIGVSMIGCAPESAYRGIEYSDSVFQVVS